MFAGSATPDARPSAATSSRIVRNIRHVSGMLRTTPTGHRVSAVRPAWAQMKRYFSHSTRRMSDEISTGTDAAPSASRNRSQRGVVRPSSSPKTMRPPKRCAMTPGASIPANTYAAPPTAWERPSTASIFSSLSTPF